eukprot:250305-Rhodomonas_salina.1
MQSYVDQLTDDGDLSSMLDEDNKPIQQWIHKHHSSNVLGDKLLEFPMQESHTAWAVFSVKWDHDHPNEAILLREMWSDLQHELHAREHANSFYPHPLHAHSKASPTAGTSLQSFPNPVSPLQPPPSVFWSNASPGWPSQSVSRLDGSPGTQSAGGVQQAEAKPATLSALEKYHSKIAMSTPQPSPQTTPTKRALGADGVQLLYPTLKLRMYAMEIPADVDMLLGTEECGGSHGKWIKFWIKVHNKQLLDKFSRVIVGLVQVQLVDVPVSSLQTPFTPFPGPCLSSCTS